MEEKTQEIVTEAEGQTEAAIQDEADLSKMSTFDFLMAEFDKRTSPLREEELQVQLSELLRTGEALTPISEAKIKVLLTEKDVALSKGDLSKSAHKEEEIREVQRHTEDLQGQIDQARERLEAISEQKKRIAADVLDTCFLKIRSYCWAEAERFIDLLDNTFAGLQQYESQTGAHLSFQRHRNGLIPLPYGPTRHLASRLRKWGL